MRHSYDKYFLVVEDDEEISDIIKSALVEKFPSCYVIISESSIEAKRRLALQKFNAIIIDLNLKKSSGEDVALFIREKNEFNKETPLIVCSGVLDPEKFRRLSKFTKHFYVKPFSMDQLITKIESFIEDDKEKENLKKFKAA